MSEDIDYKLTNDLINIALELRKNPDRERLEADFRSTASEFQGTMAEINQLKKQLNDLVTMWNVTIEPAAIMRRIKPVIRTYILALYEELGEGAAFTIYHKHHVRIAMVAGVIMEFVTSYNEYSGQKLANLKDSIQRLIDSLRYIHRED